MAVVESFLRNIRFNEAERKYCGCHFSILMIGIFFVRISIIRNSFHNEPLNPRKTFHHTAEGGPFHINCHCSAYWNLDIFKRVITPHRTSRREWTNEAASFQWVLKGKWERSIAQIINHRFVTEYQFWQKKWFWPSLQFTNKLSPGRSMLFQFCRRNGFD